MNERNVDPSGQTSHHLPAADADRSDAADAARYRYLRDSAVWADPGHFGEVMVWCVIGSNAYACRPCETDELDAAVDAAIASMEKP